MFALAAIPLWSLRGKEWRDLRTLIIIVQAAPRFPPRQPGLIYIMKGR